MPLSKQAVPIPLANLNAGETDPKAHQGLLRLENGRFERKGAIVKRKGIRALDGSHDERFLSMHRNRAVIFDERVKVHDADGDRDGGFDDIEPGFFPGPTAGYRAGFLDVDERSLLSESAAGRIRNIEYLEKGDIAALVYTVDYQDNAVGGPFGGVFGDFAVLFETYNRNTGVLIYATGTTIDTSCMSARLLDTGADGIFIFYTGPYSTPQIRVRHIDNDGIIGAETILAALDGVEPVYSSPPRATNQLRHFDCCAVDDASNHVILTYGANPGGGGSVLQVASVATSSLPPTVTGKVNTASTGYYKSTCFKYDTGEAVVAYFDDTVTAPLGQVRADIFDATPASIATVAVLESGITDDCINICGITTAPGQQFRVFYTLQEFAAPALIAQNDVPFVRRAHASESGGTITVDRAGQTMFGGAYIGGKPLLASDGRVHLPLYYKDFLFISSFDFRDLSGGSMFFARDEGPHGQSMAANKSRITGRALTDTAGHTYIDTEDGYLKLTSRIGIGGFLSFEQAHVPATFRAPIEEISREGRDRWVLAAPKYTVNNGGNVWISAIVLNIGFQDNVKALEASKLMLVPNSNPYAFDGSRIFEQGFLHRPDNLRIDVATTGAGFLLAGTYRYVAVYEWYDHLGNLHVSQPGKAVDAVLPGAGDIPTVYVPPYISKYRNNIRVGLYRTEDPTSAVFRRVASLQMDSPNFTSFVDDGRTGYQSDTDPTILASQEELYTAGQRLGADPPPPHRIAAIFQNRVFAVPRSREEDRMQYSKELIQGIAPEFNGLLVRTITPKGGAITGLVGMHDKLIIFKRTQVYATHGTGFTATGGGANFVDPYLVSESIGCVEQKSIVLTPAGAMFLSDDGIYLLSKSLQVQPIGRRVKHYTQRHKIASAMLDAGENHVVFLTKSGPSLVYNYVYDQWATWENHEALDGAADSNGLLFFKAAQADKVFVQDQASSYDYEPGQTRIPMTIDTGWISMAGLAGYKRVYRAVVVGENLAAHQLIAKIAYDFDPTWVDEQAFDAADLRPIGTPEHYGDGLLGEFSDNAYLLELHGSRQKCTSIRYRFEDAETATVFVSAAGDEVLYFSSNNTDWSELPFFTSDEIFGIYIHAQNSLWYLGLAAIVHWDGEAATAYTPDPNGHSNAAIFGFNGAEIFAGGETGDVSVWNGELWTLAATDSVEPIRGMWGTSPQSLYVSRNNGVISKWKGFEWRTLDTGVSVDLHAIWGSGDDDIFVVGAGGMILHSENGGRSWEQRTSGTANDLNGVFGAGPGYVVAVGDSGTILVSTDGVNWAPQASGTAEDLNAVVVKNSSDATAVGQNGTILFWNGSTWASQAAPSSADINAVAIPDNSGRWSITSLTLLVGVKSGVKRLGSGRNY